MSKKYQKEFYEYQTIARGILTKDSLIQLFEQLLPFYIKKIGSFLPNSLDAKIADIPCGNGNFSYYLLKSGYKNFDSIDLDPNQVSLAQLVGINAKVYDALLWLK